MHLAFGKMQLLSSVPFLSAVNGPSEMLPSVRLNDVATRTVKNTFPNSGLDSDS